MKQEQKRQGLISEFLGTGKRNAKTAAAIADYYEMSTREVTQQIERERRAGSPICASVGNPAGYFLAENAQELESFCDQLRGRAGEIFKTRRALLDILPTLPAGGGDYDTTGDQ